MRASKTWLLAASLFGTYAIAYASMAAAAEETRGDNLGLGDSWIMGQFDDGPNQMLDASDFRRTTLAAFRAMTGGTDVLTATGVKGIVAAAEENARVSYGASLGRMDINADGNVSEAEARSAALATSSPLSVDYRVDSTMEADQDKNGIIDMEESRRAAQNSVKLIALNAKAAYSLMSLDGNGDGAVTTDEITIATDRVFVFVDINKDGFADSMEICRARSPLIDRRGLRFSMKTCF